MNHLQGNVYGVVNLGLFYEDELVQLISIGKSRYNKNYEYEILRFCTKLNTTVLGGFSKLYKHFVELYNPTSVITYADARFGSGKVYLNSNFEYKHLSQPNFFYLFNGKRESRIKYQKYKLSELLETFDPNLTGWENMKLNGFDKIWDCGNYRFEWNKP